MTQYSPTRASRPDFSDRDIPTGRLAAQTIRHPTGKYHPRCGAEHQHKPTKAIAGIGLLIVLSFLMYGINGRTPEHNSMASPGLQHNFESNAR